MAISDLGHTRALPLTTVFRRHNITLPSHSYAYAYAASNSPNAPVLPKRRLRLAHSDLRSRRSGPVRSRPPQLVYAELRSLLHKHQCVGLVVGMPLTLAFHMGSQCDKTVRFIQGLLHFLHHTEANINDEREPSSPSHPPPPSPPPSSSPGPQQQQMASKKTPPSSAVAHMYSGSSLFVSPSLYWWDERLSSSDARAQLAAYGFTGRKLAVHTDAFAAATILQEFINRLNDA